MNLLHTLLLLGLFAAQPAVAAERQAPEIIQKAVEKFMHEQTAGLPGEYEFTVSAPDARLVLPACESFEPSLSVSAQASANTLVTVRCMRPQSWTIYVPVRVKAVGMVLVSARPLAAGQVIGPNDVVLQKTDLNQSPAGTYADPAQLVGKTLNIGIGAGRPVSPDMLRLVPVVQQGQTVRLLSQGRGFQVATEASALANGADGRVVQVRTGTGQIISGIARPGGIVEVQF